MDEDSQDEKPLSFTHSRYRSPMFSKQEIKSLLDLIEKYKNIILNKSSNNVTIHAKEVAWMNISKIYNSQGFKHKRSSDRLKMKWDNLKRDARKVSKNLVEVDEDDLNEVTNRVVAMINDSDNNVDPVLPKDFYVEVEGLEEVNESKDDESSVLNDETEMKENELFTPDCERKKRLNRSMNFTPQESSILLKCVRSEKKFVFTKECNTKAIQYKNRAWARITQSFNKLSPYKRSTKILRNKFKNMKKFANREKVKLFKSEKKKYSLLEDNDCTGNIKSEPIIDSDDDIDGDFDDNLIPTNAPEGSPSNSNFDSLLLKEDIVAVNVAPDPLSAVLNSDSGLGSINGELCSCAENKQEKKIRLELLHYQMETAKLERKRIEENIRADSDNIQARATETALRLRAARLGAVAAAMKLTVGHPALQFYPDEALAQQYLSQYHQT